MRYIVRPKLSGDAQKFGKEGAQGTMVYAESAAVARQRGATELGLSGAQVEVIEYQDAPSVISGPDRPLTKEEAAEIWNQETRAQPDSWEGI